VSESGIRVVHYGLGPIGAAALRMVADRAELRIVGAIDVDPGKVGRDAGEVAALGRNLGLAVEADAVRVLAESKPQVVVHCTASFLADVMPQLREIIAAGANIVSTCEELAYPWTRRPELAAELDVLARGRGVTVLGTGVNPGFVMDLLPLVLSAVTSRLRSVRVTRVVDAAHRRGPLQRKIGAGITPDDFAQRAAGGRMGHIGLAESLHMVAAGLGWDLKEITDTLEPVLATQQITTPHVSVQPGQVAGIHQVAAGHTASGQTIELDLAMYVGAPNPRDELRIDGDPGAHLLIPGGVFGDSATVAMVANAVPAVQAAPPGLRTMRDLPPVVAGR
jgi:4-hydroxy-tetrahydrodipicolinate reductase